MKVISIGTTGSAVVIDDAAEYMEQQRPVQLQLDLKSTPRVRFSAEHKKRALELIRPPNA